MTKNEVETLETLLSKFGTEVGSYRFCIMSGAVGENFQIGIYNSEGNLTYSSFGITLQDCVTKIKLKSPLFKVT